MVLRIRVVGHLNPYLPSGEAAQDLRGTGPTREAMCYIDDAELTDPTPQCERDFRRSALYLP